MQTCKDFHYIKNICKLKFYVGKDFSLTWKVCMFGYFFIYKRGKKGQIRNKRQYLVSRLRQRNIQWCF